MKNLQISDNDTFGKRFNGHNLHRYLIAAGIDSKEIVWNRTSEEPTTSGLAETVSDRHLFNHYVTKLEQHYNAQSLLYPFSFDLLHNRHFLEADVVHMHLIHNYFFNIMHLPILTKLKPTVWTLHDPWALTGHCIHSFDCDRWQRGCGNCPDLDINFAIKKDTSALNWEIKKLYLQASDLNIIVASQWMLDLVKKSPLFSHCKTHLIPFGINLDLFKPYNKSSLKKYFKIPANNFVLCFRAASWPLKGLSYIKEMLALLDPAIPLTLIVNTESNLIEDDLRKKYQVIGLDWISDDDLLVKMYAVSDLFLMPSLAESFGMSAVEAMACGTPVIVFDDNVLTDTIAAPRGGIAVKKGSAVAMKEAVERLYKDKPLLQHLSEEARKLTLEQYNKDDYVKKIIAVYEEMIENRKRNVRNEFIIAQQLKQLSEDNLTIIPSLTEQIPKQIHSSLFKVLRKIRNFYRLKKKRF